MLLLILNLLVSPITAIASPIDDSDSLQCLDLVTPNHVAFDTMANYLRNRISFNPLKPDYTGNYVEILEPQHVLHARHFAAYESEFVIKLVLSHLGVQKIEPDAFAALDCLNYLRLERNNLRALTSAMFAGLRRLRELNLSENQIESVPVDVFQHMGALRTLRLSWNRIAAFDGDVFRNIRTLTDLDLGHNRLAAVSDSAFTHLSQLTKLDLSYNRLESVPLQSWQHLDSLKSLILTGNKLESLDFSASYSYNALQYLYLAENKLTQLDVKPALKQRFPKLLVCEIALNPWRCDILLDMIQYLNARRITYAHHNISDSNVQGIDCNDSPRITTELPFFHNDTTTSTSRTEHAETSRDDSDSVIDMVETIKTIALCILVLIVLFVVYECLLKAGVIDRVIRSFRCGNDRLYAHYDEAEHVRLIHSRSRL